jgi:hypothetical protein
MPFHAVSYAPLIEVPSAYRAAGAEVFNVGAHPLVRIADKAAA